MSLSPAKKKLLELETTGKYIFHGSDVNIEEFEPRQAHNHIDGVNHPDGEPAIFASSKVEYAIFMAIINRTNCTRGYHSSVEARGGIVTFKATEDTLEQLTDESSGFVYVFNRNLFSLRDKDGIEYVSLVKVRPVEKIAVTKRDLPDQIELI